MTTRTRGFGWALILALVVGSCGDDGDRDADAGTDAGNDAGTDAGIDSGIDSGPPPPPVNFVGRPTIALVGSSASSATLEVFARSSNTRIFRRARVAGTWGAWTNVFDASSFRADPDVASWGSDRLDLAVRGDCAGVTNGICQRFRITTFTGDFEMNEGEQGLVGSPTLAAAMSQRLLLVAPRAPGSETTLSYRYWNGGVWSSWSVYEDYPDTTTAFASLGYADSQCQVGGSCTEYENYYVTSATGAGRVMVARLVVYLGSFVGAEVDALPELAGTVLVEPSISVVLDGSVGLAVYATTSRAPGASPLLYRLGGTPLAVDHAPGTPGDYDFDETNVTWDASWVAMPAAPSRLVSGHDCLASNLYPDFEACVATAEDGAVWMLERIDGTATWTSLGRP